MPVQARRCRWGRDSDERIFGQARRRHGRPPRFPGWRHRGVRRPRATRGFGQTAPPVPPPTEGGKSYRTAGELVADLAARRVSAVELLDQAIARIERLDKSINAVVVRDFDRRAPGGDRGRPGAGARRAAAAARPADDREGGVQRRRPADDLGHPRLQGLAAARGCRRRRTAEGRRRRDHRQDQRAGRARRLAEHESDLWHHQQSLRSRADARRLVGRRGRRAGGRLRGPRGRLGHRRLAAHAGALLRRVRPQADLRHRADARPHRPETAGVAFGRRRPGGGRADGAQRATISRSRST